ncbi:MAG: PilZ domain-containing protein [Alphaproteobacteria bacterium]|nr:PilZ domain-containing protein [Alphaproteobacteria bacterium]MBU2142730.1 PilZ domain-containing protein [Alphaproteobacteria bacterium]MBU2197478.1 PilZ domain-containing protein [Alphaproteobacteria bacterium]
MNVMDDKTASARARVNMPGRILVAGLDETRDCLIRDLSAHGANLEVRDWAEVPREFYLLFPGRANRAGVRGTCQRRWQVGDVVGVRFIDAAVDIAVRNTLSDDTDLYARLTGLPLKI